MSAIISVGEESVKMSTGSAEALRLGLVAYLRESGEDRTALGARVIDALELMWPADLSDELPPYDEAPVRELLGPGWLALARDVAEPQPRLVGGVRWDRLDRAWRIVWIADLIRIARAWTGVDLSRELTSAWPPHEQRVFAVWLAETAIASAWGRFRREPTAEHRETLEAALRAQAAKAAATDAEITSAIASLHARIRARAAELAAEGR